MAYADRVKLIAELEKKRGSKIITLILSDRSSTTQFNGIQATIAPDQVNQIVEHLKLFQGKKYSDELVELLIYTRGGDTNTAWILVNTIRNFAKKFNVLVPVFSHSAGTLIALGANSIVMTRTASLSPIDPTVANAFNPKEGNVPQGISVEDVTSFMALAKDKDRVGVVSEKQLTEVFRILAEKVHPLALGNVKRSHTQIRILAKKLLELHINREKEKDRVEKIIDTLTEKFYTHYHLIFRKEAQDLGLTNVVEADEKEEDILWSIYKDYEAELKLKEFFDVNMFLGAKEEDTLETKTVFIESTEKSSSLNIKQLIKRALLQDYGLRLQVLGMESQFAVNSGNLKIQIGNIIANLANLHAQVVANPAIAGPMAPLLVHLQNAIGGLTQITGAPNKLDTSDLKPIVEAKVLEIKWV